MLPVSVYRHWTLLHARIAIWQAGMKSVSAYLPSEPSMLSAKVQGLRPVDFTAHYRSSIVTRFQTTHGIRNNVKNGF